MSEIRTQTSLVAAMHHLAIAKHYFDDYTRQNNGSRAGKLVAMYSRKCDWIAKDLALHPLLPSEIQNRIKLEFKSDVFLITEIQEKVHLLSPDQRELVSKIVDGFLAGEEIIFTETHEDDADGQ